jgi:VanZ family protein
MILIIWLLIVLFLSIIPVKGPQTDLPMDKIIHIIVYGITAYIFIRNLRIRMPFLKSIFLSVILASSYGLAMELLQYALPWRQFSLSDEAANISGALFFGILYAVKNYRRKI